MPNRCYSWVCATHLKKTKADVPSTSLGIAYAGHAREEVKELILPIVEDCGLSLELVGIGEKVPLDQYGRIINVSSSAASLALGLVYVGSCNSEITEAISAALLERPVESLDESTHTRFIGLGLGLLYLGKQSQAEVPLELVKVVEGMINRMSVPRMAVSSSSTFVGNAGKYAELCLETCAYAGTGSVLKIQRLLHVCGVGCLCLFDILMLNPYRNSHRMMLLPRLKRKIRKKSLLRLCLIAYLWQYLESP